MFARKGQFITSQGLASEGSTEGLEALGPEYTPRSVPSKKNQSSICPPKASKVSRPAGPATMPHKTMAILEVSGEQKQ